MLSTVTNGSAKHSQTQPSTTGLDGHGHDHEHDVHLDIDHGHLKWDDIPSLVFFTGEVVVSLLCIFGNALVLEAIRRYRNLHTPTNLFIFNLAVSDFLVGLVVVPFHLIFNEGIVRLAFSQCLLTNCLMLVVSYSTILMLLVIASERFIATRFPFFYCQNVDMDSARVVTVVVYVTSASLGMIPMMGWNVGLRGFQDHHNSACEFDAVFAADFMVYFNLILMFLVPLFIITFVYTYIALVVSRIQTDSIALHERFKVKFKRDVKTTKMVAIVITAFTCLWLPLNTLKGIHFYGNSSFCDFTGEVTKDGHPCEFPRILLWLAIWLSHFHSVVNPIIYAMGNSNVNVAMSNVLLNRSVPLPNDSSFSSYLSRKARKLSEQKKITLEQDYRKGRISLMQEFDETAKEILHDTEKTLLGVEAPTDSVLIQNGLCYDEQCNDSEYNRIGSVVNTVTESKTLSEEEIT